MTDAFADQGDPCAEEASDTTPMPWSTVRFRLAVGRLHLERDLSMAFVPQRGEHVEAWPDGPTLVVEETRWSFHGLPLVHLVPSESAVEIIGFIDNRDLLLAVMAANGWEAIPSTA